MYLADSRQLLSNIATFDGIVEDQHGGSMPLGDGKSKLRLVIPDWEEDAAVLPISVEV